MKKIIISILLTIMCCFMCTACEVVQSERITPTVNDAYRFQYIGQDPVNAKGTAQGGDAVQYYVDNKTSIVYIVMIDTAANGTWAGLTPLIDTDGTYVTYDEFIAED